MRAPGAEIGDGADNGVVDGHIQGVDADGDQLAEVFGEQDVQVHLADHGDCAEQIGRRSCGANHEKLEPRPAPAELLAQHGDLAPLLFVDRVQVVDDQHPDQGGKMLGSLSRPHARVRSIGRRRRPLALQPGADVGQTRVGLAGLGNLQHRLNPQNVHPGGGKWLLHDRLEGI